MSLGRIHKVKAKESVDLSEWIVKKGDTKLGKLIMTSSGGTISPTQRKEVAS